MSGFCRWKTLCAAVLLSVAAEIPTSAQVFTTLANLKGGNGPNPSLVQGTDGNFYGTQPNGGGTVIKLTPTGTVTVLVQFNGANGWNPGAGLVLGTDGNFYGTTGGGGGAYRSGTVFKITPSGKLTTLYGFCALSNCSDGEAPLAALVQGRDGNFYGTTEGGGGRQCSGGCGTVFKIAPDGTLTTLHRFHFLDDGAFPAAALVQATDGNFYGTTYDGGQCCNGGNLDGTVFKMTPAGRLTRLYDFCAQERCADGDNPLGLLQSTDGNFYGITEQGGYLQGCFGSGCGTVYKITGRGMLTTLYAFAGENDGAGPGTLVQATDGNFYGPTIDGGAERGGTLFTITPEGRLTTLHDFCGVRLPCRIGGWTPTELIQATDGKFYGTTFQGGASGAGTFFSLDVGLSPFATFIRSNGKAGDTVGILGQGFTGTTSVSFNGIPGKFTVISNTFIKATVPAGATTGYVTVTTPSGKLTSNVPFRVIP
jgi:uncharacterized repeat protein (TIGR03803 family)